MTERTADTVDDEIHAVRKEIWKLEERIAELRKSRPAEPVQDWEVTTSNGARVRLSALFGGKRELVLVHNMGRKCPMCTCWADGFNGIVPHLEDRAAFVVSSPDAPDEQREFAASRGWRFRMVSVAGTTLARDLGYQDEKGRYWPGISVLRRSDDGSLVRVSTAGFGPGDPLGLMFKVLDLFPGGEEWWPQISYGG
jgi:predicted dithiol-disulfide oxidoreductase (DUF899 family)